MKVAITDIISCFLVFTLDDLKLSDLKPLRALGKDARFLLEHTHRAAT
jgi:hypothetical protein